MKEAPDFDVAAAHKYFAADCFNKAWDLIENPVRTPDDNRLMVALNQASIFHWLNRSDCDNKRLTIGYWQASRIQSLLGNASEALLHAEVCLNYSSGLEPFHVGYAYEALARAVALAGENERAAEYRLKAEAQAALVTNSESRALLVKDLAELRPPFAGG